MAKRNMVPMKVLAIYELKNMDEENNSPEQPLFQNRFLILIQEISGKRALLIIAGSHEGVLLGSVLEKTDPPVPFIEKQMINLIQELGGEVINAQIEGIDKMNVYTASVEVRRKRDGAGIVLRVGAVEAMAIGLMAGCPVMINDQLLEPTGGVIKTLNELKFAGSDPSEMEIH